MNGILQLVTQIWGDIINNWQPAVPVSESLEKVWYPTHEHVDNYNKCYQLYPIFG